MKRRLALVLTEHDAQVLERALERTWGGQRISDSDWVSLTRTMGRLRAVRSGAGQADAAIVEAVRGVPPCSLRVEIRRAA